MHVDDGVYIYIYIYGIFLVNWHFKKRYFYEICTFWGVDYEYEIRF